MTRSSKTNPLLTCAFALGTALTTIPGSATAQTFYIGEVRNFGFDFCQRGTLPADGRLLPISSYTALFSLLGTFYGGDGRTTFALPDLRSRHPVHMGRGPGLTDVTLGERIGTPTVTLTELNLANHNHMVNANNLDGDKAGPGNKLLAAAPPGGSGSETIYSDQGPTVQMSSQMIASTGSGQPFDIQDPYLVTNFCVVTEGVYPSRP